MDLIELHLQLRESRQLDVELFAHLVQLVFERQGCRRGSAAVPAVQPGRVRPSRPVGRSGRARRSRPVRRPHLARQSRHGRRVRPSLPVGQSLSPCGQFYVIGRRGIRTSSVYTLPGGTLHDATAAIPRRATSLSLACAVRGAFHLRGGSGGDQALGVAV